MSGPRSSALSGNTGSPNLDRFLNRIPGGSAVLSSTPVSIRPAVRYTDSAENGSHAAVVRDKNKQKRVGGGTPRPPFAPMCECGGRFQDCGGPLTCPRGGARYSHLRVVPGGGR